MKRHKQLRQPSSERGQALVEFAFSMIVLAFLLLGVIEFGMLLYNYIVVVDATDEAAAYASIYPYERDLDGSCTPPCRIDNDQDIIARLRDTSAGNSIIQESNYFSITITPDYLHRQPCSTVTVIARYHHRFMFPLFGPGLDLHYQTVKMIAPPGSMGICPSQ
jgi:hypothetical protein